jgi:hypothetical protein
MDSVRHHAATQHMQMQTTHQGSGSPSPLALMCWQHGGHACSQHATTQSGMSQMWHHHPFSGCVLGGRALRVSPGYAQLSTPPLVTHTLNSNNTPNNTLQQQTITNTTTSYLIPPVHSIQSKLACKVLRFDDIQSADLASLVV